MEFESLLQDVKGSLINAKLGVEDDSIYMKCANLCNKYSLTSKELTGTLDAFLLNIGKTILSNDLLGRIEQSIIGDSSKRQRTKYSESPVFQSASKVNRSITFSTPDAHDLSKISSNLLQSPNFDISSSQSSNLDTISIGPKFSDRIDAGKVLLTFNEHLDSRDEFEPSSLKPIGFRCRIINDDEIFSNISHRYRYMYTELEERTKALDKQLSKIQRDMCTFINIDEKDLQPVGVPSQEMVWVCARICCEAAEGKINKTSIILEGSYRDCGGRRLKLDLKDIDSYSLFPGQIVLVEGVSSSGRVIVAKRIIEGIPKPLAHSVPSKLLEYHHSNQFQNSQPLSIVVASGPFSLSSNLLYEPLHSLIRKIYKAKPDVAIIVGPFVDVTHPLLRTGDVILESSEEENGTHSASYELVFIEKIVRDTFVAMFNLEEGNEYIPTQFVLIPSLQDAHHEFVFPQPPFADRDVVIDNNFFNEQIGSLNIPFSKDSDLRKRIHLMPNPCMFKINEILFGVTSNDVLFSLSSDETSQNIGSNRLARLASHVLQQQSFSPQFPLPSSALSQHDFRQSRHWQMNASPDILIMPSKLTHMVKEVFGTLVINPGSLAKGTTGGTYAEITIHPMTESNIRSSIIDGKSSIPHSVHNRSKVQIIKV